MAISKNEMYELAKKGNSAAQYNCGLYSLEVESYSSAIQHFAKAAEQNNAYALFALGVFCELDIGDFSEIDDEEERKGIAKDFFQKAHNYGHPNAGKAINNGSGFGSLSAFEKTTKLLDINYTPQKPAASSSGGSTPVNVTRDGSIVRNTLPSSNGSSKQRIKYQNGEIYEGEIINGKPNGKGKYTWADGSIYEGDWNNFNRHGKGIDRASSGSIYEGDWFNDLKHGKGKYKFPDGRIYEGEFKNGEPYGKGKLTYPDGKSKIIDGSIYFTSK